MKNDGTLDSSFYSSGGGWDWCADQYYAAPYVYLNIGGNNTPSEGMATVIITGQILDAFENWESLVVSFDEYYYIDGGGANDAGGGDSGIPTTDCGPIDGGTNLIDWAKISQFEGNRLDGYVPTKNGQPFAQSGVTIASGFDLGQRNEADLVKLGFSAALQAKLHPYLGMKGVAATNYENVHPLNVTSAEARTISQAAHATTLAAVVTKYDSAVGVSGTFFVLPAEAQTVIASVAFQYGNLATATPIFWAQVTTKDWTGAIANLNDFGDAFDTRRGGEAAILQSALNAGKLHNGAFC